MSFAPAQPAKNLTDRSVALEIKDTFALKALVAGHVLLLQSTVGCPHESAHSLTEQLGQRGQHALVCQEEVVGGAQRALCLG